MSMKQKLVREIKAVVLTTAYFAAWFGLLIVLKELILAEYDVRFRHLSVAIIGALIVAKVVLVLEHVSLGSWVRRQPAWVDVGLRTMIYSVCVFVVLLVEKGIEGRREDGGFVEAIGRAIVQSDADHFAATTIAVAVALLGFNATSVLRKHLGEHGLRHIFLSPLPNEQPTSAAGASPAHRNQT
jgi:hypothetical protein